MYADVKVTTNTNVCIPLPRLSAMPDCLPEEERSKGAHQHWYALAYIPMPWVGTIDNRSSFKHVELKEVPHAGVAQSIRRREMVALEYHLESTLKAVLGRT